MSRVFTLEPASKYPQTLVWLLVACIIGILVATQSLFVSAAVFGITALIICSAITPLAAFILLMLVAPMRTLIATESPIQLPLDIGQLAILAVIAFWAIYRVPRKQPLLNLSFSTLILPITLFALSVTPSFLVAPALGAWISEWLKWLQILLLILLVLNTSHENSWEWLLFGLTLAGVTNALVGLYEFLGGSGAEHLLIKDRFFRAFGTFGQPNPFGGFMGLLAPLTLMAFLGYLGRLHKHWRQTKRVNPSLAVITLFYAGSVALIILGIFISWSRGAWLGFVLSLAVVAFALPFKVRYSILSVSVIALTIGILWFSGRLPASIVARISSATEEFFAFEDMRGVDISPENYPVVERLAHWQAAINMIRESPYIGIGFGNYEIAYPQYRLINWHFPLGHAHNYYLNIWAETGMIGLAGYCVMWLSILWLTWRARQHPDFLARSVAIGLLGTWTYLSVHSIFDNLYVNNLFLHLGIMLGILAVLYNQTWKPLIWGKN